MTEKKKRGRPRTNPVGERITHVGAQLPEKMYDDFSAKIRSEGITFRSWLTARVKDYLEVTGEY